MSCLLRGFFYRLKMRGKLRVVDLQVKIVQPKKEGPLPVRLIILAKPAESAEKERVRVQRNGSKRQHKPDTRSLIAAGYVMIVTSLAADIFPAQDVAALYRAPRYDTWVALTRTD